MMPAAQSQWGRVSSDRTAIPGVIERSPHVALRPFVERFLIGRFNGIHRIHYVDEGAGPTLLCLHGNPAQIVEEMHAFLTALDAMSSER